MARRRFSERDTLRTLIIQGAKIVCYRSGEPITLENVGAVEREHLVTVALGGADEPENCRYSLAAAHKVQTNGKPATSYGSDRHAIDKVKRIVKGGNKPRGRPLTGGRKLEGRGFQKPPPGYKHNWDKRTMGRKT